MNDVTGQKGRWAIRCEDCSRSERTAFEQIPRVAFHVHALPDISFGGPIPQNSVLELPNLKGLDASRVTTFARRLLISPGTSFESNLK